MSTEWPNGYLIISLLMVIFDECYSLGFITVATEAVDLLCFVVMASLQMQLSRFLKPDCYNFL
jgi:hypothetical protein